MKYRKKPVVIDAFRWNGEYDSSKCPEWFVEAVNSGIVNIKSPSLFITTLEGIHEARLNDYIIQGIQGELYPFKPDIFEKTYEKYIE